MLEKAGKALYNLVCYKVNNQKKTQFKGAAI
jgi:hypothetical protein